MSKIHHTKSDEKLLFGWDLFSNVGPPVPYSISSKYKKDWKDLKTEAKKKRVRDYAEYKMSMQTAAVKLEEVAAPAPTSSAPAAAEKKVCDSEGDDLWSYTELKRNLQRASKLAIGNRNVIFDLAQDVEKMEDRVCELEAQLAKQMGNLNIS